MSMNVCKNVCGVHANERGVELGIGGAEAVDCTRTEAVVEHHSALPTATLSLPSQVHPVSFRPQI